uniref:Sema domain-containing protein n=1 Tax=Electrophorus electricus TaxID=8005 RepID=A0A4W4E280_ELEEL
MSERLIVAMPPGMVRVLFALLPVLLCCALTQSSTPSARYPVFVRNDTLFEHLALHPDPAVGCVYLGARDHLFQLSPTLQLEEEAEMGPVTDSRDCLPPISETSCPQARLTSNHNKLLLVDPYSGELISCGSVHQGTCQKRSLKDVGTVLFAPERPVDTQYVAANDPDVSTVGLVVQAGVGHKSLLFVGRGYTSSQPPISTRNLASEPVFSYEETAKLAVAGRLSEYDHHFVGAFARRSHVYFLFYRRDLKSSAREYRTYASRICLEDAAYYSYVEVPLSCQSAAGKKYNLLQAARVGLGQPGLEGSQAGEDILLGVFSATSSKPSEESALCVYSLQDIDARIDATRDHCYTKVGRADGQEAAYIEYDVKSICANLPENTLDAYPCGSDHTPSPMASRVPVEAEPILDSPSTRLTAVAVSMRAGHTIAFLGDSNGNLHKVFLGPNGEVEEYAIIPIQPKIPISSELMLDQSEEHLYIMSSTMLEKRPVAECYMHVDCQSCLSAHDPYCGWCVLEGRCGQREECVHGEEADHWLWSFDMEQQCLSVHTLTPSNISREESRPIALSIPALPKLKDGESYSCFFQDSYSPATVTDSGITCPSPQPQRVPNVLGGQGETDFITVTLSLRFGDVIVTSREFTFYDCTVVKQLSGSMPCRGCVSSRWGCNWCVHQHMCTHKAVCEQGVIIYNENVTNVPPPSPPATTPAKGSTVSPALTHALPTTTMPTEPPPTTTTPTTTATPTTQPPTTSARTATPELPTTAAPVPVPTPSTLPTTPQAPTGTTTRLVPTAEAPTTVTPHTNPTLPLLSEADSKIRPPKGLPPAEEEMLSQTESVVITSARTQSSHVTWASLDGIVSMCVCARACYLMCGCLKQADEGSLLSWGASACPCVEKVQGSPLLPVQTKRKITLLARNLHLYQDQDLEYECVLVIEGRTVVVDAYVEKDEMNPSLFDITCQHHQYSYSGLVEEYNAMVYVKRRDTFHVDSANDLYVTLYNCSVGRSDCSRCHTADLKYSCVWCEGPARSSCVFHGSCSHNVRPTCPAPLIHSVEPLSGLVEGGTTLTISGSNLGQKAQDVLQSVTVAGVSCAVDPHLYEISSRIVCITGPSDTERTGHVLVKVSSVGSGMSSQKFTYQSPVLEDIRPRRGPRAGGTALTITGLRLLTGRAGNISVWLGDVPLHSHQDVSEVQEGRIECVTGASNKTGEHQVTVRYGKSERHLNGSGFLYTPDPNITHAMPSKSFISGGRVIHVSGHNLDVVQEPRMQVTVYLLDSTRSRRHASRRSRRNAGSVINAEVEQELLWRHRRILPEPDCLEDTLCSVKHFEERCEVNTTSLLLCRTPAVSSQVIGAVTRVKFLLDNLHIHFNTVSQSPFTYEPNPTLHPLNYRDPSAIHQPFRYKPGSVISVEGENLDLAIFKEEVVALIGEGVCVVKTLTRNHLYCEPPPQQPAPPPSNGRKRDGADALPDFTVQMGSLNFSLGRVQYDTLSQSTFPMEAQIGVGAVASLVVLIVVIIVLIYRRKSKQALRDYKKVQIQLENLETSVRDRCKKEFTDLMTEMMDMTSDLVGSGIPFLDYKMYAERIFFPGHRESPLRRDLDVQDCRRATVEQGLVQLSNLLNSKLFLTKFIHTLESQRTFSPRDRAYVASLLTVALHGKLEYFTDILKTLLNDLVEQYVAKNPKLMLRRTETVVEKLLTNWMSICLYAFLRDSAGESLYMLFRAIKHQVDKGPVDAVTGKAKYTLNDNRLLREDLEYRTLTLNVQLQGAAVTETQPLAAKVLDCDTITQVKEKILEQVYKGTSYSHRPHTDSLDLEWRSGVAGHLILSDEDLTSIVQGNWKRLNTLQHYKVPDGATVALVPRNSKHIHHDNHDYVAGEKTPMLEDADEGGVRLWHLVKASEEPELPKHRRGSLRDRERAKAIPEIYLTRLLSVKVPPTLTRLLQAH